MHATTKVAREPSLPPPRGINFNRTLVAGWFLHGFGIEIGALHQPLAVPAGARVRYVDRFSREQLRKHYPELNALPVVDPDVIDDGERLNKFPDNSQDFIVACHFLEHCEDPIGALHTFRRVLKQGGILYLVIPDKLYTFDKDRPSTPFDHLVRDHEEGPLWSRDGHFVEWCEKVDKFAPGAPAREHADFLKAINYSIHFHVWTKPELLNTVQAINEQYALGLQLQCFVNNGEEGIYILAKAQNAGWPAEIHNGLHRVSMQLLSRAARRLGHRLWQARSRLRARSMNASAASQQPATRRS